MAKVVWQIFKDMFCTIYRESKHEEEIRNAIKEYLSKKSEELNLGLSFHEDEIGNLLIKVPPSKGSENVPSLLLQGHLDMVCETDREDFNFKTQPIPIQEIEEENKGKVIKWLTSDRTTLGADNGIGVSIGIALLFDPDFIEGRITHGPIEVLLTIDEETGLTGAFEADLIALSIESKYLINMDSEDWGIITIGSAGGGGTRLVQNFESFKINNPEEFSLVNISVSGLLGGHSGVDIHKPLGNAIKILARILSAVINTNHNLEPHLLSWNGGSKHNAIPRTSEATVLVPKEQIETFLSLINGELQKINPYFEKIEPNIETQMKIMDSFKPTENVPLDSIISIKDTKTLIRTINAIPHGVIRFSPTIECLVETSNNLAILSMHSSTHTSTSMHAGSHTPTKNITYSIHCSSRSNVDSELEAFRRSLLDMNKGCKWQIIQKEGYPGWTPAPENPFLNYVKQQYNSHLTEEVKIEAVHAGLETSIIGKKIEGIQMVSIGPTIENPHSPQERLDIDSVNKFYTLMKDIISNFNLL